MALISNRRIRWGLFPAMMVGVLAAVLGCAPSEREPATAAQGANNNQPRVSRSAGTTRGAGTQPAVAVLEESARVPAPQAGQKKVVLEQLGMT